MSIQDVFYDNIVNKCKVIAGDRILLGISGGPDSLCLFNLLFSFKESLGIELGIAHIHHGLRGEASDEDALFVERLAQQYGVPFYGLNENVGKVARDNGWSLEEAGRKVRYEFFNKVMDEEGYNLLAVGHHQNDQSETVLLHLLRGAGIRGLGGMAFRSGRCIRPLLSISREVIMTYIKEEDIPYCIDKTNEEASFLRNRVRLQLVPELQKYNKGITKHLFRLSQIAEEENDYIEKKVASIKEKYVKIREHKAFFNWQVLDEAPVLRKRLYQLIYYELSGKSLYYDYVNKMDAYLFNRGENKRLGLPGNMILKKSEEHFCLETSEREEVLPYSLIVEGEGDYRLEGGVLTIREMEVPFEDLKGDPLEGFLAFEKIKWPLTIRNRQPGDAFVPFGHKRPVKVKDLYIKRKVDSWRRDVFPQLLDREGQILFIPVLGINEEFKIRENGEKVLYIYYEEINCHR